MIEPGIVLRFAYRQFHTDGRLQNLYETLNEIGAGLVLLNFVDAGFDDEILSQEKVDERLEIVKQSTKRLKKRKFNAELVLPSLSDCSDKEHKKYLIELYKQAVETGCKTLWVDETALVNGIADKSALDRKLFYKQLGKEVHKVNKKVSLGLLAQEPKTYARLGLTALNLAAALADDGEPLLAQTQPFRDDYNRVELLEAAATAAISQKQCYHALDNIALLGNINQIYASPFHKAAESTQMQINLNVLFGHRQVILNCFDEMGTAPKVDNLYLQMIKANRKFVSKLGEYVPHDTYYEGIRFIVPDNAPEGYDYSAAIMLWRMGLPVSFINAGDITEDYDRSMTAVMCGEVPAELDRDQLDAVFTGGVLLDAKAAETIHNMGLPGLLGSKIGGEIEDVCTEILCFQAYANRYYGHQTMFRNRVGADKFRQIEPFHSNCRVITELTRHGKQANVDGMVIFDNLEHHHRSAILPFELNAETCKLLLCPARQTHTIDILQWLQRNPLLCQVEGTPDLVPFLGFDPEEDRIILTLTNVGFDWAIDCRIRFGNLPFKVKKVKELDEQGNIIKDKELKMSTEGSYNYIHLNTDFAVPPMQMLILILEG